MSCGRTVVALLRGLPRWPGGAPCAAAPCAEAVSLVRIIFLYQEEEVPNDVKVAGHAAPPDQGAMHGTERSAKPYGARRGWLWWARRRHGTCTMRWWAWCSEWLEALEVPGRGGGGGARRGESPSAALKGTISHCHGGRYAGGARDRVGGGVCMPCAHLGREGGG